MVFKFFNEKLDPSFDGTWHGRRRAVVGGKAKLRRYKRESAALWKRKSVTERYRYFKSSGETSVYFSRGAIGAN